MDVKGCRWKSDELFMGERKMRELFLKTAFFASLSALAVAEDISPSFFTLIPDEVVKSIRASNRVLAREMREFRASPAIVLLDKEGRSALEKAILFFERHSKLGQSPEELEVFFNGLESVAGKHEDVEKTEQLATWRFAPPCELKKGDLILARSTDVWSGYFANASLRDNRFSHIAVVSGVGVKPVLVETINGPDGETHFGRRSWSDVCGSAVDCAVYRYAGTENVRAKIGDEAEKRVGIPFDASFDLKTKNRLYCAEMVRDSVNEAAGHEVIGTSRKGSFEYVAIDDCYRKSFVKVFDARDWKGEEAKGGRAQAPTLMPKQTRATAPTQPTPIKSTSTTNRIIRIRFIPGR